MSDTAAVREATPSVQEMLREFRHLMDERLALEAKRSRRARFLGWTALLVALLATAGTAGLLYFAFYQDLPLLTAPSVRAREVVLVDGAGVERGLWSVDENGAARLVMKDGDGVARLKLTLTPDGEQALSFADAEGGNRVVLGHLADHTSTLAFADARGTTRAVLGMSPSEATSLLFADGNGGTRAAMGLLPSGEPTFWWPEVGQADEDPEGP